MLCCRRMLYLYKDENILCGDEKPDYPTVGTGVGFQVWGLGFLKPCGIGNVFTIA